MSDRKLVWNERSAIQKTALKMLEHRVGYTLFRNDHKPYCDKPVKVWRYQRPGEGSISLEIEHWAPCRSCEKCLLFRQLQWAERMTQELQAAPRSWFVTLTFSEIHLAGIISEAYQKYGKASAREIELAAYAHVQKYLKRLRKTCGKFRFCAVPEYGDESGRLHYHLLVHETGHGAVLHRHLDGQWRSHTQANLVKSAAACGRYVSKYLTKNFSRIRSSQWYGQEKPSVPPRNKKQSGRRNDVPPLPSGKTVGEE